jgi:hypothetical protein
MVKVNGGIEIVDSGGTPRNRCVCSEDSADEYGSGPCGCYCGCKGSSGFSDNDAANAWIAVGGLD